MKRKPTTADKAPAMRVVLVTLDNHLSGAVERTNATLTKEMPNLHLRMHAAADWNDDPQALERCRADIAQGDIIVCTMLFMEDHIQAVLPALHERRDACDAMICCMSAAEVMRLTRMGRFTMDGPQSGPMALLKRLRGTRKGARKPAGAQQLAILRQLPRILRFIPGTAQDLRAYFLTLQYWLASSEENVLRMVRFLVDRYADGPRQALRGSLKSQSPIEYPDLGVYHPRLKKRISENQRELPRPKGEIRGTVGLLIMRSYVLAGNTAHYDHIIAQLEARGLAVITAFASGLDARPAVRRFFMQDGRSQVDAVVSLTGFSLVGGPAYNDARAAEELLTELDVPYIAAQPVEFQSLDQWERSEQGLMPLEATMMVAIPELDGATGPIVYGGHAETDGAHDMQPHPERVETLVARVERLINLRKTPHAERKVAIVLFNFPPNAGNTGTAAHLSVFASLHNTLQALQRQGYNVAVPASVDELRKRIIEGNAVSHGMLANVHAAIDVDDHVHREPWLKEIEAQWGPAPGKQLSNGRSIFVLGAQFGNVLVGVQPGFGHEGDPMKLLFSRGFAPTHAFSAFYRYLREDFAADAVMHFGTHGALEFMPGKQVGMSQACWPDRLIGDLPNFYLYASNNPSEGMIAKRRAAATLLSYLTPPIARADLYRGLSELKGSIDRWRERCDQGADQRTELAELIRTQAMALDLVAGDDAAWDSDPDAQIERLRLALIELEETLIPYGLHVVGEAPSREQRIDMLQALAQATHEIQLEPRVIEALIDGESPQEALTGAGLQAEEALIAVCSELAATDKLLAQDHELQAMLKALDGRFIPPAPGGDLLRNPAVLPTGRNLHGFDPFRLPSTFAIQDGGRQAQRLLQRHSDEGNALPESIALVLWGTDNLKTEGGPIAQALALMGARPRFDSYGRVAGATLIPLEELGRPRIDVVMTLSGIFRDLLPLQTKLLAEAAYLAAAADEAPEQNFVRKHALAYQAQHDCDLETAALRVFSNAEGAYGSNVNLLVDNSRWDDEDELAETYTQRKSFAYGVSGKPTQQSALLDDMLAGVQLAYQNLDSVELGITTVDHYFDTLGGISRAVRRSSGKEIPVYISDQTSGDGRVRTLTEQVALETRTRMLNPKWYEGILEHGYEGVRQIESHVTNTVGWSATTGQVAPWVYERLSQTFILDDAMRERLASLNPTASVKVAHRLLEAHERQYWNPDDATLDALRRAGEDLEDRLEGITQEVAA
ncbi:MAG: magnesium chelatase subunit H [Chromatiaceae bacterium]